MKKGSMLNLRSTVWTPLDRTSVSRFAIAAAIASLLTGCSGVPLPVLEVPPTTSLATSSRAHSIDPRLLRGPGPVPANAVIVRAIDGDTVVARIGRRTEHVRLLGIDTPETHRPGTPIECFGPEASAFTGALLPPGTPVRLTRDVEARDRYGRLLGQIQRARDGLWIDEALVRSGMAAAKHYAPNLAGTDALVSAQSDAQSNGRGLWGACGGPHEEAPATSPP